MASGKTKSIATFLGPFLLLVGLLWAAAAEQGILPIRHALQYGLTVAASGLIVWGLHGLRAGRRRLLSLSVLLPGGAFYAVHLHYLSEDYRLAGTEPLRTLLPDYQDQLLVRIMLVSAMLFASCLLGLLGGNRRPYGESTPKAARKRRRPQTAPVKASRLVRSLRR